MDPGFRAERIAPRDPTDGRANSRDPTDLFQEWASTFLALSFHVDYWDNLGWPDRNALADAVSRRRGYARGFGKSSVCTPQVIIDGRGDFVGSDRRRLRGAFHEDLETLDSLNEILTLV